MNTKLSIIALAVIQFGFFKSAFADDEPVPGELAIYNYNPVVGVGHQQQNHSNSA